MPHGMNAYDEKQKRAVRRRNHTTLDVEKRIRQKERKRSKYPPKWEEVDPEDIE